MKKLLASILCIQLLATGVSPALAAELDIPFDVPANYTIDALTTEVVDSEARLKESPFLDVQDPGEFGAGSHTNTQWDGANSWLSLITPSAGTFTSRVFDAINTTHPWDGARWVPGHAYGKDLPDNQGVESGYAVTNADMQNNAALLHFDGEGTDDSGWGNNAVQMGDTPSYVPGVFGEAASFDGQDDLLSAPSDPSLNVTTAGTIGGWLQAGTADFAYQRPLTLSTATTEDEVTLELTFDNTTFDYSKVQDDGDDIRFSDGNGQLLPYWIETWKDGANETSRLWVKVFKAGTTGILMHYGNSEVTQGSTGKDTFLMFADMEEGGSDREALDIIGVGSGGYNPGLDYYEDGAYVVDGISAGQRGFKTKEMIPARSRVELVGQYTIAYVYGQGTSAPALCNVVEGRHKPGASWVAAGTSFFCWNSSTVSTFDKSYGVEIPFNPLNVYTQRRVDGTDPVSANDDLRVSVTYEPGKLDVNVTGDKTYSNSWTGVDDYVAEAYYFIVGYNYKVNQKIYYTFARAVDPAEPTIALGTEVLNTSPLAYAGDWMYERTISISGTVPEDEYQVRLALPTDFPMDKVNSNLSDLRFFQASDGRELPYWIGHKKLLSGIWIKLWDKNEDTIIMKYGNPHVQQAAFHGEEVFDFFDNLTGETLSDKWDYEERRGDEPEYTSIASNLISLFNGRWVRNLGSLRDYGGARGHYVQFTTKQALTGNKAVSIMYSKNYNQGYFCARYGEDGDYSSIGYRDSYAFMNVYRGDTHPGYEESTCPAGIWETTGDASTDRGATITLPRFGSIGTSSIEEFQIAPDGIKRHFFSDGYTDGHQFPAPELEQSETGVRTPRDSGHLRIMFSAGWSAGVESSMNQVIVRKQGPLGQEPTLTVNDDERIIGAGRHGDYGIALSGNKAYLSFGKFHEGIWLNKGWNHLVGTLSGTVLSMFHNGAKIAENTAVTAVIPHATSLELGGASDRTHGAASHASMVIDEFNVHTVALSTAQILNHYLRGALDLTFQIRSCDDAICDGDTFVGPDGTPGTTYNEADNDTLTPPMIQGLPVGANQYAQYQMSMTGDGLYAPIVREAGLLPSSYAASGPAVLSALTAAYHTLAGFIETLGASHTGTTGYQLSNNGTTWYYWDTATSTWTASTGANYPTEVSSAADIQAGLPYFAHQVGTGTISIKTYLGSDGGQPSSVDRLQVTYGTTNTAPHAPADVFVNTVSEGAQVGRTNPLDLDEKNIKVSAILSDPDLGDLLTDVQVEVATDNAFSNIVYDSTKTSLGLGVITGNRMQDLTLTGGSFLHDTRYYLRVRAWDASDNVSPYSTTAEFEIPDVSAPVLLSSTPADTDSGVDVQPTITLELTDDISGVDTATLEVEVGGDLAIDAGVCQAGFSCSINTLNDVVTVTITPDTAFGYEEDITVNVTVSDKVTVPHELQTSFTFTTQVNGAPSEPTDIFMNTVAITAQTAEVSGATFDATELVWSAIHHDPEGHSASAYQVQIARDSGFTDVVYDVQDAFATPVADGARSPDLLIPDGTLALEESYYLRVKFWDSEGKEGAFSPAGALSYVLHLVDATAPVLVSSGPVQGETTVARTTPITLVIDDVESGIDEQTLNVFVGGVPAITDGVCQAGFACAIQVVGTQLEVEILPDDDFAYNKVVSVDIEVANTAANTQDLVTSITFTTLPQPVAIKPPTVTGGGGGFTSSGATGTTTPTTTTTPTVPTTTTRPAAPDTTGMPTTQTNTNTSTPTVTEEAEDADDAVAVTITTPEGEERAVWLDVLTEVALPNATGGITMETYRPAVDNMIESLETAFFPVIGTTRSEVPSLPQKAVSVSGSPASYEESVCSQLTPRYSYILPDDLSVELQRDIQMLHKIGVNFSKGQGVLDVKEEVTRSELLKYLLQLSCADFAYDVTGVPRFPDVATSHPNDLYIQVGRKYKLVSGYLHDGLFRPDQTITEAEALKITLEFFSDEPVLDGVRELFSVNYSDWFGRYVRYASDQVVLMQSDSFDPNKKIALEDAIQLMVRSLTLRGK